jgi:hypothetical protein
VRCYPGVLYAHSNLSGNCIGNRPGYTFGGQSLAGLAAVSGTVVDGSQAAAPNARVTVKNDNTGVVRRLETNESGYFLASSLQPGPGYEVSVEKEGFAMYEAKGLLLQVGQNVALKVSLAIAQQAQTITVEDDG